MELYQIPVYRSADEFLAFVAHKIGKLKKGGVPDYHAAAVSVLRDWQVQWRGFCKQRINSLCFSVWQDQVLHNASRAQHCHRVVGDCDSVGKGKGEKKKKVWESF